jgi:serine/threonine protein kinase
MTTSAGRSASIGTLLGGRYTLIQRIAFGGMGEVWAASDAVLGRTVAVKLLHPALSHDSGFAERFRAEARHTAGLAHPNIAAVFDYGEDDGTAYLVMERVVGQPLSQVIAERAPLPAKETTAILVQAAAALQAAHQGGVVHRDVKPANILVTPDGTVKLTDFGISRADASAPLTQTGQFLGTAEYLSPEQALGGPATAASDIYALGVVGYEMLTGLRPFDAGSVVATALAHVNRPAPLLPDTVPVRIRDVISAALAKDPADRPASAADMARALGMPVASLGASPPPPATDPRSTTSPPTLVMAGQTRPLPVQRTAETSDRSDGEGSASGIPDRRSRRGPAWLLGTAALIGLLSFLALTHGSGDGPSTPVATPPATGVTAAAPTAVFAPAPSQPPSGRGRGNGGSSNGGSSNGGGNGTGNKKGK